MAKKDLFENMNITDNSYLLDDNLLASEVKTGRSNEETVKLSELEEFPGHPFMVNTENEDFEEMVESIKENGLIYPILVRPVAGGEKYQIISGHRRVAASKVAGLSEIPAIIRPMDEFEATVLMVHSNLYRPEISIKEKALAYRLCHDAEKHQGKHLGGDTAVNIGEKASDSRRKVYRYIRLSYLSDLLLDAVDKKRMPINVGIELSYLTQKTQEQLSEIIEEYHMLPSIEQAAVLRKLSIEHGDISKEKMIALLLGEEKKKAAKTSVSFKKKDIQDFFAPDTEVDRMSEIIMQLLAKYRDGALKDFID